MPIDLRNRSATVYSSFSFTQPRFESLPSAAAETSVLKLRLERATLRPVHIAISRRHIRRDGMDLLKKLEKDGDISQDDHRKLQDEVQKMTDETIKKIDELLAAKDKDIMQV